MSTLALCLLIALLVATGSFYLAAYLSGHGGGWATDLCFQAPNLCDHPQWIGYASAVMLVVYLILHGIES
jgi:hypothetical protein